MHMTERARGPAASARSRFAVGAGMEHVRERAHGVVWRTARRELDRPADVDGLRRGGVEGHARDLDERRESLRSRIEGHRFEIELEDGVNAELVGWNLITDRAVASLHACSVPAGFSRRSESPPPVFAAITFCEAVFRTRAGSAVASSVLRRYSLPLPASSIAAAMSRERQGRAREPHLGTQNYTQFVSFIYISYKSDKI